MTKRPTIKNIASRASVSFKTVSRVINNEAGVAPAIRERVQAAIEALGYQPHLGARQMRSGKTGTLCLFLTSRDQLGALSQEHRMPSYATDVLTGMLQACSNSGHHLVIGHIASFNVSEGREPLVKFLDQVRPEGVLVIPPLCDVDWVIEMFDERALSVMRFNPGTRLESGGWFGIDNVQAGRDVGKMLVDFGHREIGYVAGPENHKAARGRLVGLQSALSGIGDARLAVRQGDFLFESGLAAGRDLLAASTRPTAIFAANDEMAAGVLAAAVECGVAVPEELSIVGFGGLVISGQTWPRLSTVSQPTIEMARRACESLITASKDGAGRLPGVLVPHQILIRQSVADAPEVPSE